MDIYGVIMAGGGGTRFWPLSRQSRPKQFLNLSGKELMINEALDRLAYTVDRSKLFVVTNAAQAEIMHSATAERLLPDHILAEPCARNTAACIGYAAMEILKKYGDGIMIITPSDAYIKDNAAFTRTLAEAVRAAQTQDKLVTVGIAPTYPATGYGYIRFEHSGDAAAKQVTEFKEKPDLKTAQNYLAQGDYVWNSGMFIWKASVILQKYKQMIPDIYASLEEIGEAMKTDREAQTLCEIYPTIRKISVDYAIMEPAATDGDVLVIPGTFGWSDVGSFDSLDLLHEADANGNILQGDVVVIDGSHNVVFSDKKLIAAVGVDELVIVDTEDALLVCKKESAQDVRKVVDALQAMGHGELL